MRNSVSPVLIFVSTYGLAKRCLSAVLDKMFLGPVEKVSTSLCQDFSGWHQCFNLCVQEPRQYGVKWLCAFKVWKQIFHFCIQGFREQEHFEIAYPRFTRFDSRNSLAANVPAEVLQLEHKLLLRPVL